MKFGLILAGGLGKRMESSIPKVLHQINSKPMICYVIEKAFEIGCDRIGIIVGKYKQIILNTITQWFNQDPRIIWIDQEEPLGTAHSVLSAMNWMETNLHPETDILVLSGDVPLISSHTLESLMSKSNSILVTSLCQPQGYGRVIIDYEKNTIKQIVEEKDSTQEEKNINLVNCGIYSIQLSILSKTIYLINNTNAANEYYLTDMLKIAYDLGYQINWYELSNSKSIEIANINTKQDLQNIQTILTNKFLFDCSN